MQSDKILAIYRALRDDARAIRPLSLCELANLFGSAHQGDDGKIVVESDYDDVADARVGAMGGEYVDQDLFDIGEEDVMAGVPRTYGLGEGSGGNGSGGGGEVVKLPRNLVDLFAEEGGDEDEQEFSADVDMEEEEVPNFEAGGESDLEF